MGEITGEKPHDWLRQFVLSRTLDELCQSLDARGGGVGVEGSCGSSTHLLAGALALRTGRSVLLVVAHLDEADDALDDLELFPAAGFTLVAQRLPALEVLPGESSVSLDLLAQRLAVVRHVLPSENQKSKIENPLVLVAPIQALMQAVPQPDALDDLSRTITAGQTLSPAELIDWLDRAGYQRNDTVEQPGEFASRGGIIDIFPPTPGDQSTNCPVRLDYFGDEIESIRPIDLDTMASPPQAPKIQRIQLLGGSTRRLMSDERTTSFLSLLPPRTLVVMHETMELSEQARGYYERLTNPRGIYSPASVLQNLAKFSHLEVNQYGRSSAGGRAIRLPVSALTNFDQEAGKAIAELAEISSHDRVTVLCQKDAERQRLVELLRDKHPDAIARLALEVGYLHRGFAWDDSPEKAKIHLVPHHELFHRYLTRRRVRAISGGFSASRPTDAFVELSPDDYVVHADHGIALFRGLRTMRRNHKAEEYLTLEFAQGALLHVPVTQIELVQKYVGGFQGRPPLSVLGGKRWAKQKQQAAEAVKDLAQQMLRISAARASLPGVRFPPDTPWQKEFEAEFPYEETDDQLAAIAEIKKDMADEQPMDRLICGDVGFGKTEVAIRAAFKAAEFGRQVAVLVPTTVLAEQHEQTFRMRMADYPFRVASLSRFKTDLEQRKVLEALASGGVDIVIGTHRLLSQDIQFADLGLVIIDEEQRFGVEHKQKLLQFRLTADVLTLSATPIPRTLHMAMLGLRDISSLSTPPLDRRAIVTEVMPFDRKRVQQAIGRELSRDGQVYFVHNRVHDIESVADEIQKLAPDARVLIGHGQMPPRQLEEVMLAFMRRQADILVCTTIIESGIDIPTANTMFIDQADMYGLADLHQLRGRVGRYKHRAYCYLLLPEDRPITDQAMRRLKAIEQYSMLGAGFKIAMRDLEIRGAGNLLGTEQSGHIAAVGYEMYCRLLEQAAKKLRQAPGEEPTPTATHLELPLAGRIGRDYIASDKYRMDAYRRLHRAATLKQFDAVVADLVDAYGKPPAVTQTLLDLTELRVAAGLLGVEAIRLEGQDVIFRTPLPRKLDPLLRIATGRASVIDPHTVYYRPPAKYLDPPATLLALLRKLLVMPQREST